MKKEKIVSRVVKGIIVKGKFVVDDKVEVKDVVLPVNLHDSKEIIDYNNSHVDDIMIKVLDVKRVQISLKIPVFEMYNISVIYGTAEVICDDKEVICDDLDGGVQDA